MAGVGVAGGGGRGAAGRGRGATGGAPAPAIPGPGARGPPPPPRDNVAPAPRNHHRKPGETSSDPKISHPNFKTSNSKIHFPLHSYNFNTKPGWSAR